jgi:hypothetical protein
MTLPEIDEVAVKDLRLTKAYLENDSTTVFVFLGNDCAKKASPQGLWNRRS